MRTLNLYNPLHTLHFIRILPLWYVNEEKMARMIQIFPLSLYLPLLYYLGACLQLETSTVCISLPMMKMIFLFFFVSLPQISTVRNLLLSYCC